MIYASRSLTICESQICTLQSTQRLDPLVLASFGVIVRKGEREIWISRALGTFGKSDMRMLEPRRRGFRFLCSVAAIVFDKSFCNTLGNVLTGRIIYLFCIQVSTRSGSLSMLTQDPRLQILPKPPTHPHTWTIPLHLYNPILNNDILEIRLACHGYRTRIRSRNKRHGQLHPQLQDRF